MKKALLLVIPAAALAIAATALGQPNRASGPARAGVTGSTLVKCGKTRTIGFLVPKTGPAASVGAQQIAWANFAVSAWNKSHKSKIKLMLEDTQLGVSTAIANNAAKAVASNASALAIVGPAGSNEIVAATQTMKNAGLAWVSGSSTRTSLTLDGTRTGYMFRTVPPDAKQGTTAANFILKKLKVKRVYIIDDQETYSEGLADTVQSKLKAKGVSVGRDGVSQQESAFQSLIAKIPRNTQLVYIPWQLADKAKAFGQQMKASGRGGIKLMGADGLYSDQFAGLGKNIYDTNFPLKPTSGIIKAFRKAHGGNGQYFGAPTYAATVVVATAIDKACKNGTASRPEVRGLIAKTKIPAAKSPIGVLLHFNKNGDLINPNHFGVYKSNGKTFLPIA
jgi:branched-chain amino acid transport system substrate-binding protein